MKLISCHIVNFGVLCNQRIDFTQGLNTICQSNGWGKSTLAVFIKAMFYGLSGDRLQDIDKNEYLKYSPFNRQTFGGSLVFEHNGNVYRIERFFDAKNKSDGVYKLFDARTNNPSNDFPSKLGTEIFGVDADSFERSCYLPQKDIRVENSDSITAKLSNLIENTNDVNNCDSALKLLDEQRKRYDKRGGKGAIAEVQDAINLAQRRLLSAEQQVTQINTLKQVQDGLEGQIKALEGQIKTVDNDLVLGERYSMQIANRASYDKLKAQYDATFEQYQHSCQQYNIDDNTAQLLQQNKQFLQQIKAQENILQDMENGQAERVNLANANALLPPTKQANKSRLPLVPILLTALCALLVIVGAICLTAYKIVGITLIAIGCVSLITAIVLFVSKHKNNSTPIDTQPIPLPTQPTIMDSRYESINNSIADYTAKIKSFLQSINYPYADICKGLELLESRLLQVTQLENSLSSQKAMIDNFVNSTDLGSDEVPNNFNAEQLRLKRKNIDTELQNCRTKLVHTQSQIVDTQRIVDTIPDIAQEIADNTDTLNQYKDKLNVILLTMQHLQDAKSSLQSMYLPKMQQYTNTYLSMIEDKAPQIMLTDKLEALFVHNGQSKSADYLSAGYRDLVDFCIRLSLTDCLCGEQKQLIILDDPFVNFDKDKQITAINLLKILATKYQIIYLVCSVDRVPK